MIGQGGEKQDAFLQITNINIS